VAPASSGNSGVFYRVVVGLTDPKAKLDSGTIGTVSILTNEAKSALAVPTSAVTTAGTRHTVTLMRNGKPTVVTIGVGVVGAVWTQVTSGLTGGEHIVLADLSSPLPGSATASSGSGTNGANNPTIIQLPNGSRITFGNAGSTNGK
jgi:multidrug efflux pump subunit AcrA (membrane-fusion protein)